MLSCKYLSSYVFSFVMFNCSLSLYNSSSHFAHYYSMTGKLYTVLFSQRVKKFMYIKLIKCTLYRYAYACMHYIVLFNPFLTRFFIIISLIKTVFFDNSITLKTVLICVSRINLMCLTKTSVV